MNTVKMSAACINLILLDSSMTYHQQFSVMYRWEFIINSH